MGCGAVVHGERRSCVACHSLSRDNDGGKSGPSLTGVGKRLTREQIIDQLLFPQKTKNPRGVQVEFRTGRLQSFFLLRETKEMLVVRDPQTNKESQVTIADLESHTKSAIMPEGMVDRLSPAAFADLVEYLVSLK